MSASSYFDDFVKDHPRSYIHEKFSYVASGKGKTAFLIFPGSGEDEYSCYNFISHFEKQYRVIVPNYKHYSGLPAFFDTIQEILKKERITSIILYGHSFGGFLAQLFPREHLMPHALILSHTSTLLSPTIQKNIIKPAKVILPLALRLPSSLMARKVVKRLLSLFQAHTISVEKLYKKYASQEVWRRAQEFGDFFTYPLSDKNFIRGVYHIGLDAESAEHSQKTDSHIPDHILILRTDNDPIARDDGTMTKRYPHATIHTFHHTGHLTNYIQIDQMIKVIDSFLESHQL